MPLIKGKSKEAFGKNVSSEMDAGKSQKQALAIAYAVKRKAGKKMAKGGMVNPELKEAGKGSSPLAEYLDTQRLGFKGQEHEDIAEPLESKSVGEDEQYMAHGGAVLHKADDIVHAIMAKKMAQGGQIPEDLSYLDEDDSYPDPDGKELDMLDEDPIKMADGGPVLDPQKVADAQASMRKAFHYADGGEVDPNMKKKKRIAQIFASMHDED